MPLRLSGIRRQGAVGAIATFLALFLINLALKGGHFSAFDLKTLCMNVLPLALVALGQFFVVMTNGIDLSLGPVMSVAGSIAALTFSASVPGAVALALGAAALAGACNGLLVVRLRLPPILATLATMSIFQGVALVDSLESRRERASRLDGRPHQRSRPGPYPASAVDCGCRRHVLDHERPAWIVAPGDRRRRRAARGRAECRCKG